MRKEFNNLPKRFEQTTEIGAVLIPLLPGLSVFVKSEHQMTQTFTPNAPGSPGARPMCLMTSRHWSKNSQRPLETLLSFPFAGLARGAALLSCGLGLEANFHLKQPPLSTKTVAKGLTRWLLIHLSGFQFSGKTKNVIHRTMDDVRVMLFRNYFDSD